MINDKQMAYNNVADAVAYWSSVHPDKVAVTDGKTNLTYSQLHQHSEQLAQYLHASGVRAGDRIIIAADKHPSILIVILSAFKLGAAYVPLDSKSPLDRLVYLMKDVQPSAAFISSAWYSKLSPLCSMAIPFEHIMPSGGRLEAIPTEMPLSKLTKLELPELEQLSAYCLYTSGSTGKPKGVLIQHAALHSFFAAVNTIMNINHNSQCLNTSPFHFDVSVVDVLLPLYCGASVYLYTGLIIPSIFLGIVQRRRITHFAAVAPILTLLAGDVESFRKFDLSSLTCIMTGAEVLNAKAIRSWLESIPHVLIINGYGPTEATCLCLAHQIRLTPTPDSSYPIGVPLDGVSVLLMNENEEVVPGEGEGELLIGGAQIFREYWSNEEETRVRTTVINDTRYYRSGDICGRDAGGIFHFIERRDNEVKVLGHRVNLNEIRSALIELEQVKEAIVGTIESEDRVKTVVAAISASSVQGTDTSEIKRTIRAKLPEYMVPKHIFVAGDLPKLPSGKNDVKGIMKRIDALLRQGHGKLLFPDEFNFNSTGEG